MEEDGSKCPPAKPNGVSSPFLFGLPHVIQRERELLVARLASTLTHTLGTPLQVIAGRAALARKAKTPEEAIKHVDIIQRKCTEITSLLWRVLDSVRPEHARTLSRLDVLPFVRDVAEQLSSVGGARGVRWELRAAHEATELGGLKFCFEDLKQALLSLGLNFLASAPDNSTLIIELEKVAEGGLTPVHEAVLRFTVRGAELPGRASGETLSSKDVAEPWLHADGEHVDGRTLGWAAVYELARSNEARLEVSSDEVSLYWPVLP